MTHHHAMTWKLMASAGSQEALFGLMHKRMHWQPERVGDGGELWLKGRDAPHANTRVIRKGRRWRLEYTA